MLSSSIRIAGWARDRGVGLDPMYATYDREGGTLGIDREVPAPSRQQLHVFADADWQREKGRLVHEGWLARVPR